MQKTLRAFLLAAALAVVAVPVAIAAGSPHFIKNGTGASLNGASLVCKFKETGLSSGSVQNVTCSATATTTYACVNKGGKNPSASNKRTIVSDVSRTEPVTADRNGNLTGTVTVSPPSAASLGFSCPSGQTVTLIGVTYSNILIEDETSGASFAVSGSLTYSDPRFS